MFCLLEFFFHYFGQYELLVYMYLLYSTRFRLQFDAFILIILAIITNQPFNYYVGLKPTKDSCL